MNVVDRPNLLPLHGDPLGSSRPSCRRIHPIMNDQVEKAPTSSLPRGVVDFDINPLTSQDISSSSSSSADDSADEFLVDDYVHPIVNDQVEEPPISSLCRDPVDFDIDPLASQDLSSSSSSSADEFLVDDDYSASSSSDDDGRDSTQAVKLAHTANAAAVAVGGAQVFETTSQCDDNNKRDAAEPRTRTTTQVSTTTTAATAAAATASKRDRSDPPHRLPGKWGRRPWSGNVATESKKGPENPQKPSLITRESERVEL